jgi:hypothetical protein
MIHVLIPMHDDTNWHVVYSLSIPVHSLTVDPPLARNVYTKQPIQFLPNIIIWGSLSLLLHLG